MYQLKKQIIKWLMELAQLLDVLPPAVAVLVVLSVLLVHLCADLPDVRCELELKDADANL